MVFDLQHSSICFTTGVEGTLKLLLLIFIELFYFQNFKSDLLFLLLSKMNYIDEVVPSSVLI